MESGETNEVNHDETIIRENEDMSFYLGVKNNI